MILILFSVAPIMGEEKSGVLTEQAEHAQNLLDKTISRMGYSWAKMKEHFSGGNRKVRDRAKKAAEDAVKAGRSMGKKSPVKGSGK